MTKNTSKILFLCAVLVGFGLFHQTQAVGISGDFNLKLSPKNPGPNTEVRAELISYSFDINRSSIVWMVDYRTKLRGTGEKYFSFKTKDVGVKTVLSVVIITPEGLRTEKVRVFRPADADLLWEADTYVPVGYKGKALSSSESRIKITAFPNFIGNSGKISPSRLVYDWEVNYKRISSASGYGKQSFSYTSSKLFNEDVIKLVVSDYNKNLVAEKTLKIEPGNPKILFYEDHPLEGVLRNMAIGDEFNLLKNEIAIVAEPFFFSRSGLPGISYEWMMNSSAKIEPEEKWNKIKLNVNSENPSGSSIISLEARNPLSILQFVKNSFKINFGGIIR